MNQDLMLSINNACGETKWSPVHGTCNLCLDAQMDIRCIQNGAPKYPALVWVGKGSLHMDCDDIAIRYIT